MATEANKKPTAERWPPLESNPDVMNQFIWGLGIPEGEVELHDVYGLDKELLAMVPKPVLAVLFLYPDSSQTVAGSKTEEEQILRIGMKEPSEKVYFLKQMEILGNACGTIGLLHAIGNAISKIKLRDGSCLDRFFKSTATMNPFERAAFLEKCVELQTAHSLAASAGDTEVLPDVDEHFCCFTCVDGELYELDGTKPQPVSHGPSTPTTFLQDRNKETGIKF